VQVSWCISHGTCRKWRCCIRRTEKNDTAWYYWSRGTCSFEAPTGIPSNILSTCNVCKPTKNSVVERWSMCFTLEFVHSLIYHTSNSLVACRPSLLSLSLVELVVPIFFSHFLFLFLYDVLFFSWEDLVLSRWPMCERMWQMAFTLLLFLLILYS